MSLGCSQSESLPRFQRRKPSPSQTFSTYGKAMKWLFAAVIAFALGAMFLLQRHATKTTYVNGLAAYTKLPNREFIVEKDCYIFKFKMSDSSWPLIGAHETVPALPEEVTAAHLGNDSPDVRILDILHVGDRFRIVSVRRDESRAGMTVTFEVLLADEANRKFPRVDAFWILDHSPEKKGEAPTMLPDFAVMLGHE